MGETLTVEQFDKDIQNLYSHYQKVARKYKLSLQQVTVMFASLDVKRDAGVLPQEQDDDK